MLNFAGLLSLLVMAFLFSFTCEISASFRRNSNCIVAGLPAVYVEQRDIPLTARLKFRVQQSAQQHDPLSVGSTSLTCLSESRCQSCCGTGRNDRSRNTVPNRLKNT